MTIQEIENRLKEIPGEPCGGFLYSCSHQDRHLQYFNLMQELLRLRGEERRNDLPRINALRASARAKLTPEEIAACNLEGDLEWHD